MREVFNNQGASISKAKKLKEYISQEFEANKQYDKFVKAITDCLPANAFEEAPMTQLEKDLDNKNILDDIIGL